jgi:hypothetical protein
MENLIPELQYHTSIDGRGGVGKTPTFEELKLNYHTELHGERALKENLQKLHHSLNEDNIFSLAYLILNPITSEEERKRLEERLHDKIQAMRDMKVPVLDILTNIETDLENQVENSTFEKVEENIN